MKSNFLFLANSTFIPCDGTWVMRTISLDEAKQLAHYPFTSAIGHSSTAEIISTLLDVEVSMNRITLSNLESGTQLLCFKLKQRAPEGTILTKEEIEAIGYEWKLLTLVSYRG
jgi:hypothetical protein